MENFSKFYKNIFSKNVANAGKRSKLIDKEFFKKVMNRFNLFMKNLKIFSFPFIKGVIEKNSKNIANECQHSEKIHKNIL